METVMQSGSMAVPVYDLNPGDTIIFGDDTRVKVHSATRQSIGKQYYVYDVAFQDGNGGTTPPARFTSLTAVRIAWGR